MIVRTRTWNSDRIEAIAFRTPQEAMKFGLLKKDNFIGIKPVVSPNKVERYIVTYKVPATRY